MGSCGSVQSWSERFNRAIELATVHDAADEVAPAAMPKLAHLVARERAKQDPPVAIAEPSPRRPALQHHDVKLFGIAPEPGDRCFDTRKLASTLNLVEVSLGPPRELDM